MRNKATLWRMIGLETTFLVILLDQLSKYLVMTHVFRDAYAGSLPDFLTWLFSRADRLLHPPVAMTSFFNMVMVWNPGVSFGMLQNDQVLAGYLLSGFAVLVSLGFLVWLWREPRATVAFPVGLIAGGALGNVWDRLRFGAVADFFDFYVGDWHWPAFNVADSAITIGVILLLADQMFFAKKTSQGEMRNEAI